jgi:anti-sigma factor RsiW
MATKWSEEKIAAVVDGSLDGPEAEAIRRAMDEDPDVRRYADDLRRLNGTLRDAFDVPAAANRSEYIPDAFQL